MVKIFDYLHKNVKNKIILFFLKSSNQYLFLASGVKNGEGFWLIGLKDNDQKFLDDKNLLDCYRKELIGYESAKDILFAINLNLSNLTNELSQQNYLFDSPPMGISFNIPLDILENIFDFWLERYKKKESWETCLGLLKTRKRVSLSNLIKSGSLKGNSKKLAIEIERLHCYVPKSVSKYHSNDPMWK